MGHLDRMDKRLQKLLDLVFVPHCTACGERLSPGEGALCKKCLSAYELACMATCPYCGAILADCTCLGDKLGRCGLSGLIKVFYYYPRDTAVQNFMIYALKHRADRRVVDRLSLDLAKAVKKHCDTENGNFLVTYAPRSGKAKREHGFDHMEYLARATAARLGIPCACLLARQGGGEQKKQGTEQARRRNMKDAYRYIGKAELAGKHILLLDDLMTSGATLKAAARTLRYAGAKRITAAVLAVTPLTEK